MLTFCLETLLIFIVATPFSVRLSILKGPWWSGVRPCPKVFFFAQTLRPRLLPLKWLSYSPFFFWHCRFSFGVLVPSQCWREPTKQQKNFSYM